jgi:hypothetical protein
MGSIRRYRSSPRPQEPGIPVVDVFGRTWEATLNYMDSTVAFRREGEVVVGHREKGDGQDPAKLAPRLNQALESKAKLEGRPWGGPKYVMDEDGTTWEARLEAFGHIHFRSPTGSVLIGTINDIAWPQLDEADLFSILEHSKPPRPEASR